MTEEIAFSDWFKRLERSNDNNDLSGENGTEEQATNSWLPAYGFYQPSAALQHAFQPNKNIEFCSNDMVDGACTNHLLLETIMEETSDDLRSETSESEYNCGLLTDSVSTVIHATSFEDMRQFTGTRHSCWGNRKKSGLNTDPGVQDDDDDSEDDFSDDDDCSIDTPDDSDEDPDQAGVDSFFPSRTNSLLQFENLEKHYENIFRSQHSSNGTFDSPSFENRRSHAWQFKSNSQPENLNNLGDIDDDNNDSSSLSSSCSSSSSSEIITSDEIFSSSYSSKYDSLSRKLSLRSFRSVDSLISLQQKQGKELDLFHSSDLSQSLNDNVSRIKEQKDEMVKTPARGIYKTMECLIEFTGEEHKEEGKKEGIVKSGRSTENLSEDSGFGEQINSKEKPTEVIVRQVQNGDRRCEGEDSKFSCKAWHNATTFVMGDESSDKQSEDSSSVVTASRLSVASTPNLYNYVDEAYPYKGSEETRNLHEYTASLSKGYSLKRISLEGESQLSAPSKGSNVQIMTSFINLGSSLDGSCKEIQVCPVVSEVRWWQHEYSAPSTSRELVPDLITQNALHGHEIEQMLLTDSTTSTSKRSENEIRSQQARLRVISSPPIERDGGGSHVMNVDSDANKSPSSFSQLTSTSMCDPFVEMNTSVASQPIKEKSPSKLAGFFQRFSLKRLSGRKNKGKKSKVAPPVVVEYVPKSEVAESRFVSLVDGDQIEVSAPVCSKPPLPPTAPGLWRPSDDTANLVPPRSSTPCSQQCGGHLNVSTTMLHQPTPQQIGNGLLETDIDSNVTSTSSTSNGSPSDKRSRSLLNLDNGRMPSKRLTPADRPNTTSLHHTCNDYRAKSMEFLLDKDNQDAVKVPENELQKGNGERKMSEQELRVQRSLQKLNVPEWYKNSTVPSQGFLLKRHSDTGQNQQTHHRWNASTLPSKTTSLSSLGFTLPSTSRSSTCTVTSPGPSQYSFSRWSTSRLNSGTNSSSTSPCSSARSSFNYRKPYLGWRSQEKLSKLRTPAERLAAGLLPQNAQNDGSQQFSPSLNEVRSSIKEVTSAIVHYVSGTKDSSDRLSPSTRCTTNSSSRSTSPRGSTGRLCWLESSFVGSKPLNAPETPTAASESKVDLQPKSSKNMSNEECYLNNSQNCCDNSSYNNRVNNVAADPNEDYSNQCRYDAKRRRSDGTDLFVQMLKGPKSNVDRRISCDVRSNAIKPAVSSVPPSTVKLVVQCRYHKCGKTAAPDEAKRTFKVCHNCDYVYCSRICRRDHWEQHRKVCLHSRVGELCRRVLAAIKQNEQLLLVASTVARKGFLAHGRGCVKFYFHTPQLAEHFATGSVYQPEAGFVKWTELMSSDVGNDLYSELLKVCKSYNPDTRFVVLVCIHVVSEVPSNGPVKWERQIISRYVKTKISPDLMIRNPSLCNVNEESQPPETLILTSLPESHDPSKKNRRVNFTNIQKQLRQRGISLRKQFPDVYKKLSDYVEGNEPFTPITIYPIDAASGKTFMCVIMPEDEAEKLDSILENNRNVKTIDVASAKTSSSSE